jgi:O-antigen/teichoic acid export membrane protein
MKKSNNQLGRGTIYIYIESLAAMVFGYVFWIILSRIGTVEIIGTFSAIGSLAGIFSVIASFGVPEGTQRFLGKFFYQQQLSEAKIFVTSSLILVSAGIILCSLLILIMRDWIYAVFAFDFRLIVALIMLIASYAIFLLLRSTVISSLRTKILPTTIAVSWIVRIVLATLMISIGYGTVGVAFAYTFGYIMSCLVLSITIIMILKYANHGRSEVSLSNATKDITKSSLANWIPDLIMTIGIQLGTVVVFGTYGSNEAGLYFISLIIVTGITSVVYSIFTIALPALSSMVDGRKKFAWDTIRLSTIISIPFTSSLIFYSKDIMQLIGQNYIAGSLSLQILLLSMLPTAVQAGIGVLVYSYGHYRKFLVIGLGASIPRVALYFVLVPVYGSTGASLAYSIGAIIGFAVSIIVAKRIGMLIFWKDLLLIFFIPIALTSIFSYLHVNYILAIIATIIGSDVLFLKLRILTSSDIKYLLEILPGRLSNMISVLLTRYSKK